MTPRFPDLDTAYAAGVPQELDGTPLALPDCEFCGRAFDLVRSRNALIPDLDVMKIAVRQFARMHEPFRGVWRKRFKVMLNGPARVVLSLSR